MDREDFSKRRVLLVGGGKHGMATLRAVLAIVGVTDIVQVAEARRAIDLLSTENFDVVFCDDRIEPLGGLAFPKALRASHAILNPMIPLFALHDRASRGDIERARDTGVTAVLTVPISPRTITTKLTVAFANPRPFIAAPNFFGPDRRAPRDGFGGQERRVRKPKKVVIGPRKDGGKDDAAPA